MRKRFFFSILISTIFMGLLSDPTFGASFFGVNKKSENWQKIEFENWLALEMEKTLINFLPKDSFHVQARVKVAHGRPRHKAMSMGKLTGFNSVVVKIPGSRRSFLERVHKVTYFIAIQNRVSAETRESIRNLAKSSVPLNDGQSVFVKFLDMSPPNLSYWGIWDEIKWPFVALIIALLLSLTFIRISGQDLPHIGHFFSKIFGTWKHLVGAHRQFLSHEKNNSQQNFRFSKGPLATGRFQSLLYGGAKDEPTYEYVKKIGLHDLQLLIADNPKLGAQVVRLLVAEKRRKLMVSLDAKALRNLSQYVADGQDVALNVDDLEVELAKVRKGHYPYEPEEVVIEALRNLSESEEVDFYKSLMAKGNPEKAKCLGIEVLPISLCLEFPEQTLHELFQNMSVEEKVAYAYFLEKTENQEFYKKLVVEGSKVDQLLKSEVEAHSKSKTTPNLDYEQVKSILANHCRDYLNKNSHKKENWEKPLHKWLEGLAKKGSLSDVA